MPHWRKAKLEADVIVKAEIDKKQKELQAEAEAEQLRRKAAVRPTPS